jgi:hypothetical protein
MIYTIYSDFDGIILATDDQAEAMFCVQDHLDCTLAHVAQTFNRATRNAEKSFDVAAENQDYPHVTVQVWE